MELIYGGCGDAAPICKRGVSVAWTGRGGSRIHSAAVAAPNGRVCRPVRATCSFVPPRAMAASPGRRRCHGRATDDSHRDRGRAEAWKRFRRPAHI
ncbi:hypothetical protein D4764_15G0012880 [Takifugu flavidus]|uniref:Uncharacterized protein n=1 Tax=Takifugu flavidus TaxID=433684 RepID=A0A5C6P296_9TELE|nr:hypothetical protein D4764_15G0012880 [Takifugu flavidus]